MLHKLWVLMYKPECTCSLNYPFSTNIKWYITFNSNYSIFSLYSWELYCPILSWKFMENDLPLKIFSSLTCLASLRRRPAPTPAPRSSLKRPGCAQVSTALLLISIKSWDVLTCERRQGESTGFINQKSAVTVSINRVMTTTNTIKTSRWKLHPSCKRHIITSYLWHVW